MKPTKLLVPSTPSSKPTIKPSWTLMKPSTSTTIFFSFLRENRDWEVNSLTFVDMSLSIAHLRGNWRIKSDILNRNLRFQWSNQFYSGMVQMSGGEFEMDYDQENAYFKANCLSHDVVDIFNMMADCALEPRSVVAANVIILSWPNLNCLDRYGQDALCPRTRSLFENWSLD